ncbi:angiopoietin-4-like [Ornithodoros turicata]|uniref:angiopoietin-4-like n=1 Tax=Ornithodoros turicata TaxID=34597 RepID=UPI0031392F91
MWVITTICCFVCLVASSTSTSSDDDLSHVVRELRAEIQALQRGREQDRQALKRLEERIVDIGMEVPSTPLPTAPSRHRPHRQHHAAGQRAFARSLRALQRERTALDELQAQLQRMRLDLKDAAKVETPLRSDVQKLRLEVEALRASLDEDVARGIAHSRTEEATATWLRRSLQEVRTEVAELSRQANVTSALTLSQEFKSESRLFRGDLDALRSETDSLRAATARLDARDAQTRQEIAELRGIVQKQAILQRDMSQQVSELKEDIRYLQLKQHNNEDDKQGDVYLADDGSGMEENDDETPSGGDGRTNTRHRSHHGLHSRFVRLQARVDAIARDNAKQVKDSTRLRHNHTLLSTRLEAVESNANLDLTRRHDDLVRNVTLTTQSVSKLHATTVELFRDLGTLEKKLDHGLADLRKEVSKCDFDVARALAATGDLRQDETSRLSAIGSLKADLRRLRGELQKDRRKTVALEGLLLNATILKRRHGNELTELQVRVAGLEGETARMDRKVDANSAKLGSLSRRLEGAADGRTIAEWKKKQQVLGDAIKNVSSQVPALRGNLTWLKREIGKFESNLPHDCTMQGSTPSTVLKSGVYLIRPQGSDHARRVFCDMDHAGGGWTVVQRRTDGTVDFYRNWSDYRRGFGDPDGEYWLGNAALHELSQSGNYSLRVDLWDASGHYKYVEYDRFSVGEESKGYPLEVHGYRGNASNALEYHSGMAFSTPDRDNDLSSTHCAVYYSAGWWYNHCQYVNVNGKYNVGLTWYDMDALEWVQLSRVEMKIRPQGWTKRT